MKALLSLVLTSFVAMICFVRSADAVVAAGDAIWNGSAALGAVTMNAKYKESPENGLIDQTLEVQIEDVPAGLLLRVSVNGANIGSMTTDALGVGRFRVDLLGVTPDAAGRPAGPRIESGDIVRVYRGSQGINAVMQPQP